MFCGLCLSCIVIFVFTNQNKFPGVPLKNTIQDKIPVIVWSSESKRFASGETTTKSGAIPPQDSPIISADHYRRLNDPKFIPGQNEQDNAILKRYLRQRWLVGPPVAPDSSKLKQGDVSQVKQSSFVDQQLNERENGFFIECGAADGITLSNSLYFETKRNWTGLLVEANPDFFKSLISRNRNVYAANVCLSTQKKIMAVDFKPASLVGGIETYMDDKHAEFVNKRHGKTPLVKATCFPLASLLYALDVTHVDYFSLDVEGPELEILKTIPFDKITFDIISIEYRVTDMHKIFGNESFAKLERIKGFFQEIGGYETVGVLPSKSNVPDIENEKLALDVIFKRKVNV